MNVNFGNAIVNMRHVSGIKRRNKTSYADGRNYIISIQGPNIDILWRFKIESERDDLYDKLCQYMKVVTIDLDKYIDIK